MNRDEVIRQCVVALENNAQFHDAFKAVLDGPHVESERRLHGELFALAGEKESNGLTRGYQARVEAAKAALAAWDAVDRQPLPLWFDAAVEGAVSR